MCLTERNIAEKKKDMLIFQAVLVRYLVIDFGFGSRF
jgi:hypothetical protein